MGLYIKGLDMPKDREILTLEINSKGEVTVYSTELKELECTPIAVGIPDSVIEIGAKFILLGDKVNRIMNAEE